MFETNFIFGRCNGDNSVRHIPCCLQLNNNIDVLPSWKDGVFGEA